MSYWLDDALLPRVADSPLDRLEAEGVRWRGQGNETIAIGFDDDFELLARPPASAQEATKEVAGKDVVELFRDPRARYTFTQLLDESAQDADAFNSAFWQAVWDGDIAADGFNALAAGPPAKFPIACCRRGEAGRTGNHGARPPAAPKPRAGAGDGCRVGVAGDLVPGVQTDRRGRCHRAA